MAEFMKFRRLLMYIMLAMVAVVFFTIDYTNLSFKNNRSEYISIGSGLLLALVMYFSNKIETRNK